MKRRTALGLIGAAAAAPLVRAPSARAEMLDLDPSNPAHTLMIARKLAHTMDDSIFYWWAQLLRMAMVDKIATPLWNVHVGALLKTRDIDENRAYETTAISMVFYTDLDTGEYMETFKNPFTGQEVEIGYFPAKPSRQVSSLQDSESERLSRPGFKSINIHASFKFRVGICTRLKEVGPVQAGGAISQKARLIKEFRAAANAARARDGERRKAQDAERPVRGRTAGEGAGMPGARGLAGKLAFSTPLWRSPHEQRSFRHRPRSCRTLVC